MPYVPHTPQDSRAMLQKLGLESVEELFRNLPEAIRLKRPLRIPPRKSEPEILAAFARLGADGRRMDSRPSFLGAGTYKRFIPAAVDYLSSRGEFNTAYTPYQPEVSQGTLQAIFEYQTLITRLTGMDIANASLYEAGTALAEAVLMAYGVRGKGEKVFVSAGVHPEYRKVLETYLRQHPMQLLELPLVDGATSLEPLRGVAPDEVVAVIVQSPNFFGVLERTGAVEPTLRQLSPGAERPFFIAVVDPISLAIVAPPGDVGADIAVGDGQQLGNYPSYGGPTFGFFTTRKAHVRKVPGRIVGETRDKEGKRGYVLTFQTREQHIRRERATSNICTNQGLCSLRGAMYLSLLGETGLREVAEASVRLGHHALARLSRIRGVEPVFPGSPFLWEFPVRLPIDAEAVYDALDELGVGGGLPLGRFFPARQREMLLAFTEMTSVGEIDRLAEALERITARASAPASSSPSSVSIAATP